MICIWTQQKCNWELENSEHLWTFCETHLTVKRHRKLLNATGLTQQVIQETHLSLTVVRSLQMSPTIWAHSSDHCLTNSWLLRCCMWDKDRTTASTKASTSRSTSAQTSRVVRMHCFSFKRFRWCHGQILDCMKSGVWNSTSWFSEWDSGISESEATSHLICSQGVSFFPREGSSASSTNCCSMCFFL